MATAVASVQTHTIRILYTSRRSLAVCVGPQRSLCRGPAIFGALCVGPWRSTVSGPGALCVGARRSLCWGPTLSVSGPDALLSVSGLGSLCVGLSRGRSVCRAPAPRRSLCGAPALSRRSLCRGPALSVELLCWAARSLGTFCRPLGVCIGARPVLSVSGPGAAGVGPRLCVGPRHSRSLCLAVCVGPGCAAQNSSITHPLRDPQLISPSVPPIRSAGPQLRSA